MYQKQNLIVHWKFILKNSVFGEVSHFHYGQIGHNLVLLPLGWELIRGRAKYGNYKVGLLHMKYP